MTNKKNDTSHKTDDLWWSEEKKSTAYAVHGKISFLRLIIWTALHRHQKYKTLIDDNHFAQGWVFSASVPHSDKAIPYYSQVPTICIKELFPINLSRKFPFRNCLTPGEKEYEDKTQKKERGLFNKRNKKFKHFKVNVIFRSFPKILCILIPKPTLLHNSSKWFTAKFLKILFCRFSQNISLTSFPNYPSTQFLKILIYPIS